MRNDAERGCSKNNARDQYRAGMNPVSNFLVRFFVRLQGCLLSFRQQITETKPVAQHFFSNMARDRRLKYRAIENEGVEFAVLSAGIHAGRQVGEERCVQLAPRKGRIE